MAQDALKDTSRMENESQSGRVADREDRDLLMDRHIVSGWYVQDATVYG